MPSNTQYATVTIRKTTLDRVKRNLLELVIADFEQKGALAIWTDRPSVSAFVDRAIIEKLERLSAQQVASHNHGGGDAK